MKTTLEIPDDLFRRSKAIAALRGESLKQLVAEALRRHLEYLIIDNSAPRGWRAVFGKAQPSEVAEIDAILEEEFGQIDTDSWK